MDVEHLFFKSLISDLHHQLGFNDILKCLLSCHFFYLFTVSVLLKENVFLFCQHVKHFFKLFKTELAILNQRMYNEDPQVHEVKYFLPIPDTSIPQEVPYIYHCNNSVDY